MPLKCKIFSGRNIENLTQELNTFLIEKEINSARIQQILQTQTESPNSDPNLTISIFYFAD
jgi:hypothetical protein